jgi:type IV pilus assembly protein PilV
MPINHFINTTKLQRGVTLLEVLITLIILAVGLLGLLSLQTISLKNNHSAQQRTVATMHAYDILDRIRLNTSADYTLTLAATPAGAGLKNTDLIEWIGNIATDLPLGDGSVAIAGDVVTVSVQWDDSRGANGGNNAQTFTVSTQR